QAEQHQDGGGLAGAVRAEQPEDLALRDGERHIVDRRKAVVALGQTTGFDDSLAHRRPNLAIAPAMNRTATATMATPVTPHSVEVETGTRKSAEALSPRADARNDVT